MIDLNAPFSCDTRRTLVRLSVFVHSSLRRRPSLASPRDYLLLSQCRHATVVRAAPVLDFAHHIDSVNASHGHEEVVDESPRWVPESAQDLLGVASRRLPLVHVEDEGCGRWGFGGCRRDRHSQIAPE